MTATECSLSARQRLHWLMALPAALGLAACGSAPPSPTTRSAPSMSRSSGARLSDEQASDIAIHALGLVGTTYRYGGNTPEGGFDCSGLIVYVYRHRAGVVPPRTVAQLNQFGQSVALSQLRTGDLVLFGTGRSPTHAGICVGQDRFVHAPSTGGTVRLDRITAGYWSRQNPRFRRI